MGSGSGARRGEGAPAGEKGQLNIRVDTALLEDLDTIATVEGVTRPDLVRMILQQAVDLRFGDPEWAARFEEHRASYLARLDRVARRHR